MKLGLDVSQHQLTWEEILDRVRFAEANGFDGAWVFDHFKPLYGSPSGPCMEGWTLLAGLAAATETIRLGTLVTGVTYRHPSILAAEAVTVDHISGGRLELAVGAAWFDREHHELGVPFPGPRTRAEQLEDAIHIFRALMTGDDVSYDGKHFSLDGATFNPKPVQKPHPPIWVGAGGEKIMLPLVGRLADVWHGFGSPSQLARKSEIVDGAARAAGRDPADILRSTNLSISEPLDEVRRRAVELREIGIDYLVVSWPGEGRDRVEAFLKEVEPELV